MKKLIFLLFISTTLLLSCSTPVETELTEQQKAAIIAEVESQIADFFTATQQLNFDETSEFWSTDGFISANSQGIYFPSRTIWIDQIANWWSGIESRQGTLVNKEATILSSDMALGTGTIHAVNMLMNGEVVEGNLVFSQLLKKEDSGWKTIHYHESFQPIEEEQEPE